MFFFLLNVTPNTNGNWLRKIWRRKCIFKHFSVSVSNKFWETNQPTNQSFIFQRQNTSVKIYYDSYLNLYCVIKKSKAYHKASFPLRYWSTHLSAASSEVTRQVFIDDSITILCLGVKPALSTSSWKTSLSTTNLTFFFFSNSQGKRKATCLLILARKGFGVAIFTEDVLKSKCVKSMSVHFITATLWQEIVTALHIFRGKQKPFLLRTVCTDCLKAIRT